MMGSDFPPYASLVMCLHHSFVYPVSLGSLLKTRAVGELGGSGDHTLGSSVCSLRHILLGCKVSLSQGRYRWRHNQVLTCLAAAVDKRREVNSSAAS